MADSKFAVKPYWLFQSVKGSNGNWERVDTAVGKIEM